MPRAWSRLDFTFSGASEYWNPENQEDIYIKSHIGRYRIRGYGGARPLPHLADLGFRRDVSRTGTDADVVSKVALKTEIGGLNGANPLKLSMPVMEAAEIPGSPHEPGMRAKAPELRVSLG